MTRPSLSVRPSAPLWFWLGVFALWVGVSSLRFWGLERFNTLVFDEIYFAKFGHNYLTHTPFFDAHPPLGKYLIAVGIWLKGFNPWGYRWMNALTGSCLPLIAVGLGYQLTQRYRFALLAGILMGLDGLLLVESRYGLINVYLLTFGLLGQWSALWTSQQPKGWKHWGGLILTGLSFGATAGVKWNGLGFLLGLYLLWGALRLGRLRPARFPAQPNSPLTQWSQLAPWKLFGVIPLVGALLYRLIWIPHLSQNPEFDFWEVHRQMFLYHGRVGNGPSVHPYCSPSFSWPLLWRPVSYFYQRASNLSEPMPMTGPPLPSDLTHYVYSVYATGNPPLWWATTLAIALFLGLMLWRSGLWLMGKDFQPQYRGFLAKIGILESPDIALYSVTSYVANLLPWLSISRCAFLYHYMPAYVFSSLALAWLLDHWLASPWQWWRGLALTLLLISALGFLFWLPLYLGLPLTPTAWQWRIWLPSWV
ncbi:MAG: phospholipid carrier-dependent glycosyltransferase [Thermosynechococcaceae cyanobacterium]